MQSSISVQDGLITLYDTHAHYTDSGAKLFSSISFSNCRFSPSQQLSAVSLCIKPESTAVNVHTTQLPLQLPTPPLNQQAAKRLQRALLVCRRQHHLSIFAGGQPAYDANSAKATQRNSRKQRQSNQSSLGSVVLHAVATSTSHNDNMATSHAPWPGNRMDG